MFEGISPKVLLVGMLVASLVYLLLPFDLIPDFLGIPGRIDDVAVIGFLMWLYKSNAAKFAKQQAQSSGAHSQGGSSHSTHTADDGPRALDAHTVLGIDRSASAKEIQSAYRARMQEYHPDKVAHLGQELQALAHAKCQEIQRAYQELKNYSR
ncbi:MAG: DnaJ domain-containing protein [Myxococcota bacterium]|nr:DnaJ domain-containing protein [Myxococcota bacterium]